MITKEGEEHFYILTLLFSFFYCISEITLMLIIIFCINSLFLVTQNELQSFGK